MPRGDKSTYTEKQKRKAEHIKEGYENNGLSEDESEKRAWATVNKQSGGGEKAGGSGSKKSAQEKSELRQDSAKNAAKTKSEKNHKK